MVASFAASASEILYFAQNASRETSLVTLRDENGDGGSFLAEAIGYPSVFVGG